MRIQSIEFGHFEAPCPYWELEWTAQVAEALDIPVFPVANNKI